MSDRSYTTTIEVDQTPQEAFAAINDVRGWWTGDIDGTTDQLGAEFTYHYQDQHRSRQRITELVDGRKVVWHVVDAELTFTEDVGEWTGTDIVFDIAEKDGRTEIRFTHVGLVSQFECYNNCSAAWSFLVNSSLRNRITSGKG
jgi:hypothetical protein